MILTSLEAGPRVLDQSEDRRVAHRAISGDRDVAFAQPIELPEPPGTSDIGDLRCERGSHRKQAMSAQAESS